MLRTPLPHLCVRVSCALGTVLYNFEYITHREVLGKHKQAWTDPGFLDVHRKYRVWEYSVCV